MLLGPIYVSFYTISKQIVDFSGVPASSLGFAVSATYGSQKAKGDVEKASRIYEQTLIHTLLFYLPAAAGLIIVARPTVEYIFGLEYLGAIPVLQVLSLYLILTSLMSITSRSLDYLGRARERAIAQVITSVANVILNLILIPRIGVVGAALATVFTYGTYSMSNIYITHQELDLRRDVLAKKLAAVLGITSIMSGVVFSLINHVEGIISLFIIISIGGITWLVLCYGFGFVDKDLLANLV